MAVEIVCASAGTGKTTELIRQLSDALENQTARAECVLATTFSRKAAAELVEGARRTLIGRGLWEDAQALASSWAGTVNSVCDQLVRSFAFDLGLSPDLRVVPEEHGGTMLAAALADVVQEEPCATDVRETSERFGFDMKRKTWFTHVEQIVAAARQNAMSPETLADCGVRSVDGMLSLLDPPDGRSEDELDGELAREIHEALEYLRPFRETQKNTEAAVRTLEQASFAARERRLRWPDRAELAQLYAGKSHVHRLAPLLHAAGQYMAHPGLRSDLERYVTAVFHFAQRGLSAYRDFKQERRFLDFTDQEELALGLLGDPLCVERVRGRLDLVLVDEFQDTSPLQMAIFMRLQRLASRSVWVGDPKQSIYGFRGADPSLMEGCLSTLQPSRSVLATSWRSRKPLVDLVSAAFRRVFAGQGMREDEVALQARRDESRDFAGPEAPEPLAVWLLQSSNKREDKAAIAAGVAALLADPTFRVVVGGSARAPRPGDVAILCGQNDDVEEMARALADAGLPVSVGRGGLLDTWEGRLGEAALRALLDPRDALAEGVLTCLADEGTVDEWLSQRLCGERHPLMEAVAAARTRAAGACPLEALDLALEAVEAHVRCMGRSEAGQRLANLDALRGLAARYEETCRAMSAPATPAGLAIHLRQLAEAGRDEQALVAEADAVHVLTCHASKGLEWPVVVLADLDRQPHPEPFELEVMSSSGSFDPYDPLRGRWIRLWLSPFGSRTSGVSYVDRARESATGQAWARRDSQQSARLLYVAMTRARDHLVLAVRETAHGVAAGWIERTRDASGNAVFRLPCPTTDGSIRWDVCGAAVRTRVSRFCGGARVSRRDQDLWFAYGVQGEREPEPLRLSARDFVLNPEERERLIPVGAVEFPGVSERMRRAEEPDVLGSAVHAFLASDPGPRAEVTQRTGLAARVLRAFQQEDAVAPEDLVEASDRLHAFLDVRYPGAVWHREVPLAFRHGRQEVHGIADLLLECAEGWVVVDHKTYTGPVSTWRTQGMAHLAQIEAYARAVEHATGARVIGRWLHFPLAGGMLQIVPD